MPLYRCAECGFLFAPQRDVGELHEIYSDEYFEQYPGGESYVDDDAQRGFEAARRLDWIQGYVDGGELLEVGAADGSFVAQAARAGFMSHGVEPAPGLAERARGQGLNVRTGFIETVELPAAEFDVICAWHVLEHVTRPHASIRRLREVIADDGYLFLETPNIESIRAKREGTTWFHLDPENHVAFYSPDQLDRLLSDCGFALLDTSTLSGFYFLRPGRALRPAELAARAVEAARERARPSRAHPWKHELLRLVARPT